MAINIDKVAAADLSSYNVEQKLTILPTAKRHAIKLNNVYAENNIYAVKNVMKSRELITQSIKSIAIFCNEYIPEHFPDGQYIKYVLTINGVDHEVVPINTDHNGIKIIRSTSYGAPADYVLYLDEDIQSASLTITVTTPNRNETPYISNLKVLIGGE